MTDGLSVLAGQGGIRSKGKLTVIFEKERAQPRGAAAEIRELTALRDESLITGAEFEARKAQILAK